jgi:predicted outer membrane repeat protein
LIVTDCTFAENRAPNASGGGIRSIRGKLILADCTFTSNSALGDGGGVATDYGRVTVTNCAFNGNTALSRGGGMNNSHWGATATNCIFTENSANRGGGICMKILRSGDLTLRLSNCTFSGNVANYYGGAVCNREEGNLILTNSIAWGNSAPEGPQIAFEGWGTVSVSHSCLQGGEWDLYVGGTLNWLDGNIENDPCFVTGPVGNCYLSQILAGQAVDSQCVDAGSDSAGNQGMDAYTTRTDHVEDQGVVDMGYHYPASIYSFTCWDANQCAGQIFGDATCDGNVDLVDLLALKAGFGESAPWIPPVCCADFNHDGSVNLSDLLVLKVGFDTSGYSPSTGNQDCPP